MLLRNIRAFDFAFSIALKMCKAQLLAGKYSNPARGLNFVNKLPIILIPSKNILLRVWPLSL